MHIIYSNLKNLLIYRFVSLCTDYNIYGSGDGDGFIYCYGDGWGDGNGNCYNEDYFGSGDHFLNSYGCGYDYEYNPNKIFYDNLIFEEK